MMELESQGITDIELTELKIEELEARLEKETIKLNELKDDPFLVKITDKIRLLELEGEQNPVMRVFVNDEVFDDGEIPTRIEKPINGNFFEIYHLKHTRKDYMKPLIDQNEVVLSLRMQLDSLRDLVSMLEYDGESIDIFDASFEQSRSAAGVIDVGSTEIAVFDVVLNIVKKIKNVFKRR